MDMDIMRLCLSSVLLALLGARVVQSAGYNFDNSYYNQVILDQLDDYFRPWRYDMDEGYGRRERPRFRNPICCGHYEEENLRREDRIREECYNRVFNTSWALYGYDDGWNQFNCEATNEVKNKIRCVHRCMWKLRGTFDDKYNRVTGTKLREYYRNTETQGWRRDIQDKAVTKCLPNYNPNRYRVDRSGECNRVHLDFSYCLWEEFHSNCPEREWNGRSRYCNRVKEYLRSRRREFSF